MFLEFSPERFLPQERISFLQPVGFQHIASRHVANVALFASFYLGLSFIPFTFSFHFIFILQSCKERNIIDYGAKIT
jgi:hypothetical protein